MRINDLILVNIGPFRKAELEFIADESELESPPVIVITGENGTGKSIVLDAIRTLFMGPFRNVERDIVASEPFQLEGNITLNSQRFKVTATTKKKEYIEFTQTSISSLFVNHLDHKYERNFIFDYWTSKLADDSFEIPSISALDPDTYLDNALEGIQQNVVVSKMITFLDYLKDSKDKTERVLGNYLYSLVEKIFEISLVDGKLSHVSRTSLKPIVRIREKELTLDKLSSGNLYLVQRYMSLLKQVYSISILNNLEISDYKNIKGVLLIDEAENHLHPKWQKVLIRNILELFPKLQIIVTTHSPFIVSSIPNSRVFVCQSLDNSSIIVEETDIYSNKPSEEILMSPLFNTSNFNSEISGLLKERKQAAIENNAAEVSRIEGLLLEINPEYFNYLNIESLLKSINK